LRLSKILLLCTVLLCIITLYEIAAQSEFMDKNQKGFGGDVRMVMRETQFADIILGSGYSVNGVLDFGVNLGYGMEETSYMQSGFSKDSINSKQFKVSVQYSFTLIKQDRLIPFSLVMPGTLSTMIVNSKTLDEKGLVQSGTGYTIGLELFSYIYAAPRFYFRYGVFGEKKSATYVVEKMDGGKGENYPIGKNAGTFYYGGILGFSFRPNRANRGVAVSFDIRGYSDKNFTLYYAPSINITVVQKKLGEAGS